MLSETSKGLRCQIEALTSKTMKTLTEYTKNGYRFTLVKRQGNIAIFRGEYIEAPSIAGHFEVIRIQSHNGREVHGKWCEPTEYPPSNNQWGADGFTCMRRERAEERFAELVEKEAFKAHFRKAEITK